LVKPALVLQKKFLPLQWLILKKPFMKANSFEDK